LYLISNQTKTQKEEANMKLNKIKTVRENEVAQFEQEANKHGLYKTSQGKTFMANDREFTIAGIRQNSKKMPVVATDVEGQAYKFSAEYVVEQLKAQAVQKKTMGASVEAAVADAGNDADAETVAEEVVEAAEEVVEG
jgi:hypothetical protein